MSITTFSGEIRKRRGVRTKVVQSRDSVVTKYSKNTSGTINASNKVSHISNTFDGNYTTKSLSSNQFNIVYSYLVDYFNDIVATDITLFIFENARFYNKSPLQILNEYKRYLEENKDNKNYDLFLGLENILSGSETQRLQAAIPKQNKKILI